MNSRSLLSTMALAIALAGCATPPLADATASEFGDANRATYAAMIVNPDPHYDAPMTTSGEQAAAAADRVRKGTVKQPDSIRTTSGTGGGSGGGN